MPTLTNVAGDHEPRGSLRNHWQAPQICTSPPKTVYLPTEVQLIVLEYLPKKDLKQLRQVSKEWQLLASPPLFETIYVSPHQLDMESYKCITQNAMLAAAVKRLVYDMATFRLNLTHNDYWEWLFWDFLDIASRWKDEPFRCPDDQINSIVEECKESDADSLFGIVRNSRARILWTHKQDRFLSDGWRKYKANAAYEQRVLRDGRFFACLYKGLLCLPSLSALCLSEVEWAADLMNRQPLDSSTLYSPESGSSLVRSWHPFHLRPGNRWYTENGVEDMTFHFQSLIRALAETDKQVTTFELKGRMTAEIGGLPSVAMTKRLMSPDCLEQITTAFQNLEFFEIAIRAFFKEDSDNRHPIDALHSVLGQMPNLKILRLTFDNLLCRVKRYNYDEVFPFRKISPKLIELSISGLSIAAYDLFVKLLWRQPHLHYLRLANIDLIQGSWEGTIEGLRSMHFGRFELRGDLTHHEGTKLLPKLSGCDQVEWMRTIEEYIVHGGRHPYLEPGSPPFTERRWYSDLFPAAFQQDIEAWPQRTLEAARLQANSN